MRIGVLSLVFALVAAFAAYRLRPLPLPWHPLGAERIQTPAFDIADDRSRFAMNWLARKGASDLHGRWLGDSCERTFGAASEVYVLSHDGMAYREDAEEPYRIVVSLDRGGMITYEQLERSDEPSVVVRRSRAFDEDDAERFRSLLLDGGYPQMEPLGSAMTDSATLALESCIHGRYYGVIRMGSADGPSLDTLAARIKAFALEADGAR